MLSDVNERSEFTDERHVTESLSPNHIAWIIKLILLHTASHRCTISLMKKLILPIIILLLLFIAVPGEYYTRIWNTKCGMLPLDGCFSSCTGITINETCSKLNNNCFTECNNICIGLVTGTCGVNPINAKIRFLKSL